MAFGNAEQCVNAILVMDPFGNVLNAFAGSRRNTRDKG